MKSGNLLVISNSFPDKADKYVGNIFVKEQVRHFKNYFDNVYVISPLAYGVESMRKTRHEDYSFENVRVYFPRYFNVPFFFFFFREAWVRLAYRAISDLIKREGLHFDLIHAHFTWPSGATAALLKKKFGTPLVLTEHSSGTFTAAIEKRDPLFIRAWTESDLIFRVRKKDIPSFSEVGIPSEKVHYIPNGYDNAIFSGLNRDSCRKKLGLPGDKKIILNVGNLYDEVKGHRYLIEAMEKVAAKRLDVLCIIVGSGKLKDRIETQIQKAGLEAHVKLVGGKVHAEIPAWMTACDVFVLPSLNEGNPTVLFECLGCGRPFVGSGVGGIPEIVTSEEYGLLGEPANPELLAEMILESLEKEWDTENISKYGEKFRWDCLVKKMYALYPKTDQPIAIKVGNPAED